MTFPIPPLPRMSREGISLPGNRALADSVRMAQVSTKAPRIPWDEFITDILVWRQGEHMALIGPTGQGKTNQLTQLLPLHPFVVVFATKPKDESMVRLINYGGYYPIRRWQSLDPHKFPRRVLWPDAMSLDSEAKQREVFRDAFNRIYREGGWTIAIDELWYVINILGLGREVKTYLLQARALGISLLMATQRPAWVPLEVYDQSTHLFFWRDNDENNLRRLSGISFRSADLIRSIVADLDQFQVLYVNTRTGFMCRTRAPKTVA
jgi:energy-coupling factor transporter ATP-binding protein EcfA2